MQSPPAGDDWVALSAEPLPVETALAWLPLANCGGVVTFTGVVRDHAEGRLDVSELVYEAYAEQVEPRLARLADEVRRRWPAIGRIALWHRVGKLGVGESSVMVAMSAPHRGDAFDAARWAIDTLKDTVPIWKRERWRDGEDWGTDAHHIAEVSQ